MSGAKPRAKAEEASLPAAQIPLFLEQQTYRRRRLMDAARLLPALGLALVLLPVLWVPGNTGGGTARGIIYIFGVWLVLILAAVVLSRRLTVAPEEAEGDDDV